jgi:hypothetical protein
VSSITFLPTVAITRGPLTISPRLYQDGGTFENLLWPVAGSFHEYTCAGAGPAATSKAAVRPIRSALELLKMWRQGKAWNMQSGF